MPQSESVPPPSLCRVERRDGALSSRCAELRISYPTSRFQRSDGARPAPWLREPGADPACPRADPSGPASRIQRAQQHNLARIQHGSSSANRATDGPRMGSDRNGNTGRKAQGLRTSRPRVELRGWGFCAGLARRLSALCLPATGSDTRYVLPFGLPMKGTDPSRRPTAIVKAHRPEPCRCWGSGCGSRWQKASNSEGSPAPSGRTVLNAGARLSPDQAFCEGFASPFRRRASRYSEFECFLPSGRRRAVASPTGFWKNSFPS